MYAFLLGREFKLCIAELNTVFPEGDRVFLDNQILILNNILKEKVLQKASSLGGTIKIFEVKKFSSNIEKILKENLFIDDYSGKFNYAINIFGEKKIDLKTILNISKKIIKEKGYNPRFVNKDFKNLKSIQIIKEALIKKETDFNFIFDGKDVYFGKSIFVQNVYSYSNRDFGKQRDMKIGMLPPKLSQIMINLSGGKKIYDPFCGLGTILIESVNMGNKIVFGSDSNTKMVDTTKNNLLELKQKFNFEYNIFSQNAKYIKEINIYNEFDVIVTEGYLGEIMTKNNINLLRIDKQKLKLLDLYKGFFSGLKKQNFKGNIVISFPFWEYDKKYFYFTQIYDIINKEFLVNKLLKDNSLYKETKYGSLLYKRDSQLVGREIFSLKIKYE